MNAKIALARMKMRESFETAVEPLSEKSVQPNILSNQQPNLNKMIPQKAPKLVEVNIPKESKPVCVFISHMSAINLFKL